MPSEKLQKAAAELAQAAILENGGGGLSKEAVTELRKIQGTLDKVRVSAEEDPKVVEVVARLDKLEAQTKSLTLEVTKLGAAMKQSDALAEKLARKQALQAACLNLRTGKPHHVSSHLDSFVKETLELFMIDHGKYHQSSNNGYGDPKLDDVVAAIHKLTGTKPRVTTEKDGRKVIWQV